MTLTEIILIAVILILAGILGFILYALWYERNKIEQERKRKKDARWQTVFQRTDLRSQEVSHHVENHFQSRSTNDGFTTGGKLLRYGGSTFQSVGRRDWSNQTLQPQSGL